jgi:hypothetical protein
MLKSVAGEFGMQRNNQSDRVALVSVDCSSLHQRRETSEAKRKARPGQAAAGIPNVEQPPAAASAVISGGAHIVIVLGSSEVSNSGCSPLTDLGGELVVEQIVPAA